MRTDVTITLQGPAVGDWLAKHAPPGTAPPAPCCYSDRDAPAASFAIYGDRRAHTPPPAPDPEGRRLLLSFAVARWALGEVEHQVPGGKALADSDDALRLRVDFHRDDE